MPLKYALYKNHLTDEVDDYVARAQDVTSLQLKHLMDRMIVPGEITRTQLVAVLSSFFGTLKDVLKEGFAVNTDYINIFPHFGGKYDSLSDVFDPQEHELYHKVQLGTEFSTIAQSIELKKVTADIKLPKPKQIHDWESDSYNDILTPGGVLELTGENLKLEEDDPEQGIFYIQGATVYRSDKYRNNTPGKLISYIPELMDPGVYRIELRVRFRGCKDLRVNSLPYSVTVT